MGALLKSWLADDPVQADWLRTHRLMSGIYDERIKERRAALRQHGYLSSYRLASTPELVKPVASFIANHSASGTDRPPR